MPFPFDATLKDLGQVSPRGLVEVFDGPPALPVTLLNVDLSTVSTAADLVFGLGEPLQEILHLDFQASASATKHADILVYNGLLHRQYRVPVHSIAVLLRPQAAHPNLNGIVRYAPRPERGTMEFRYEVVRLWERPAAEFLAGDLSVLPFAILGQLAPGVDMATGLAEVIRQLTERLQREAQPDKAKRLLTSAFLLAGLRLPLDQARHLFKRAMVMEESTTYLGILDEGAVKEAKKIILRQGTKRFGSPDEAIKATLAAIEDLNRLEELSDRVLDARTWQELLEPQG